MGSPKQPVYPIGFECAHSYSKRIWSLSAGKKGRSLLDLQGTSG